MKEAPDNSPTCFQCNSSLAEYVGTTVGRNSECSHCSADVRVCHNCRHYDPSAYNECNESQAERIVEKGRANFCDYFSLGSGTNVATDADTAKEAALKKLNDLFK